MNLHDLPKVSIMIPTFNQESFIAQSIESALSQDYPNLEIIVSDDCSSDNTYDVVKPYLVDDRLLYFRNETNLGRVANYRKTLYERVSGIWVLNLDGDDHFYAADAVSHMIAEILRSNDNNLVAVVGSHITAHREYGHSMQPREHQEVEMFAGLDLFLNWDQRTFGHLATLYRTEIAKSVDYYRSNIISSDWESVLRLILHGNVIVTGKIIGVWNIHGSNATQNKIILDGIRDFSYIEDTYKYAEKQGISRRVLQPWFKKMIRFQTGRLWSSNARISHKLLQLLPYILRTYPFAATVFCSPKGVIKMALSRYAKSLVILEGAFNRWGAR